MARDVLRIGIVLVVFVFDREQCFSAWNMLCTRILKATSVIAHL